MQILPKIERRRRRRPQPPAAVSSSSSSLLPSPPPCNDDHDNWRRRAKLVPSETLVAFWIATATTTTTTMTLPAEAMGLWDTERSNFSQQQQHPIGVLLPSSSSKSPWAASSSQPSGFAASLPSSQALQQLRQQQDLQNQRLAQCTEAVVAVDQFEQCFFYGTSTATAASDSTESTTLRRSASSVSDGSPTARGSNNNNKAGIPTW
mmetsp:Transcript_17660/g.48106  ORF Transcript_17660/g.48106 Transcript_17660/m.48106 type:complete len:206 (+) Transcript_17660:55-672(+)